ncbi:MAG: hypothetical protein JXA68_00805 [Ignavibacteriales bacterium]|nr:hypothetical protein [Ignavibacteriales bacterium]
MRSNEKDFFSEFQQQLKKLRPWSFLMLFLFVAFLIFSILIFTFELDPIYLQILGGSILIIFIPLLFIYIKYSRCPNCKKFMGRDVGNFCPICGVKIRSTE